MFSSDKAELLTKLDELKSEVIKLNRWVRNGCKGYGAVNQLLAAETLLTRIGTIVRIETDIQRASGGSR